MLKEKRSRSQSRESNTNSFKKYKSEEGLYELINKVTDINPANKISCEFCARDITKSIRIICSKCGNIQYCLDCLVIGKGKDKTEHDHDYRLADKLDFPIFTNEWNAYEEFVLLSSIFIYAKF
jgi:late competence protein required for DNA uptake (superfamily II DNA/RNA helicase)